MLMVLVANESLIRCYRGGVVSGPPFDVQVARRRRVRTDATSITSCSRSVSVLVSPKERIAMTRFSKLVGVLGLLPAVAFAADMPKE